MNVLKLPSNHLYNVLIALINFKSPFSFSAFKTISMLKLHNMTDNLKLWRSASLTKNILEGSLLICIRCVPGQHIPPAGRRWAYLRVAGAGEVG